MGHKIRRATIDDLKNIQELNLMLFKEEYDKYDKTLDCGWTFGVKGEACFKERIVQDGGFVAIAEVDNKVVGYLAGSIVKPASYRKLSGLAELENMFVEEEFRNKGIGTELYNVFVDWCRSRKVNRLRVVASSQNSKGINFYNKKGLKNYDISLESDIQEV